MTDTPRELALQAYWQASDEARTVMMDQAKAYLAARQSALATLESRVTGAAAFLLAAAAFAAGLAYEIAPNQSAAGALAGLAGVAFAVGGMTCFRGVGTSILHIPGIEPAHWYGAHQLEEMTDADAGYFAIGLMQDSIESMRLQARRRAASLDLGLKYGIAGGALSALVGALALFS